MTNLRRVVWSKGMFLTPQHFQAQDSSQFDTLQFRFSQSLKFNSGISTLEIDPSSLGNGEFNLLQAQGILPDGLPFEIPDTDPGPDKRPFSEVIEKRENLDVYLAIPQVRVGGKNVTHLSANPADAPPAFTTRYTAKRTTVVDETVGNEEKPVEVAAKNFRILFGNEIRDGYTTLQLARIARDENGKFILDPEFIAPCLDIVSSDYLVGLLKRLIELLRNKTTTLSAGRKQKGQGLADFSTSDVASFWLLHTVNSARPELQHIAKHHGHPEPLYLALLRLAGSLSTFALDAPVLELPEYDHNNPGPCFTALDAQIRALLETVIPTKCIAIPLRRTADKTIWTATITNEQHLRDTQWFLSIASKPLAVEDLINRVHQLVKIAAPDELQHLVRWALPGVNLRHAPVPPAACATRFENQYFALGQKDKLWAAIEKSRSISVFVPSDIPSPNMEMMVVLR